MRPGRETEKVCVELCATIGFCSLTASWFMPEKVVPKGGSLISYLLHAVEVDMFRGWEGLGWSWCCLTPQSRTSLLSSTSSTPAKSPSR